MAHTLLLGASFESHELVSSPEDLPSSSHTGCLSGGLGMEASIVYSYRIRECRGCTKVGTVAA
jgi:hypothetical protein